MPPQLLPNSDTETVLADDDWQQSPDSSHLPPELSGGSDARSGSQLAPTKPPLNSDAFDDLIGNDEERLVDSPLTSLGELSDSSSTYSERHNGVHRLSSPRRSSDLYEYEPTTPLVRMTCPLPTNDPQDDKDGSNSSCSGKGDGEEVMPGLLRDQSKRRGRAWVIKDTYDSSSSPSQHSESEGSPRRMQRRRRQQQQQWLEDEDEDAQRHRDSGEPRPLPTGFRKQRKQPVSVRELLERNSLSALKKLIDEDEESELFRSRRKPGRRRNYNSSRPNEKYKCGTPQLTYFVSRGDVEVCEELLRKSADINITDNDGWTPLHEAAKQGNLEIMTLLLDPPPCDWAKPGYDAKQDKFILTPFPKVNARTRSTNSTPLHEAVRNNDTKASALLLTEGARVDLKDIQGRTALDLCSKDNESLRKALEEHLAMFKHIAQRDKTGRSRLHKACAAGKYTDVLSLIKKGIPVNHRDNAGWTPIHEAALKGHDNVVCLLIRYGANVRVKGLGGDTPLHDACANGHSSVIRHLILAGADPNAKNDKGQAPRDMVITDNTDEDGGNGEHLLLIIDHVYSQAQRQYNKPRKPPSRASPPAQEQPPQRVVNLPGMHRVSAVGGCGSSGSDATAATTVTTTSVLGGGGGGGRISGRPRTRVISDSDEEEYEGEEDEENRDRDSNVGCGQQSRNIEAEEATQRLSLSVKKLKEEAEKPSVNYYYSSTSSKLSREERKIQSYLNTIARLEGTSQRRKSNRSGDDKKRGLSPSKSLSPTMTISSRKRRRAGVRRPRNSRGSADEDKSCYHSDDADADDGGDEEEEQSSCEGSNIHDEGVGLGGGEQDHQVDGRMRDHGTPREGQDLSSQSPGSHTDSFTAVVNPGDISTEEIRCHPDHTERTRSDELLLEDSGINRTPDDLLPTQVQQPVAGPAAKLEKPALIDIANLLPRSETIGERERRHHQALITEHAMRCLPLYSVQLESLSDPGKLEFFVVDLQVRLLLEISVEDFIYGGENGDAIVEKKPRAGGAYPGGNALFEKYPKLHRFRVNDEQKERLWNPLANMLLPNLLYLDHHLGYHRVAMDWGKATAAGSDVELDGRALKQFADREKKRFIGSELYFVNLDQVVDLIKRDYPHLSQSLITITLDIEYNELVKDDRRRRQQQQGGEGGGSGGLPDRGDALLAMKREPECAGNGCIATRDCDAENTNEKDAAMATVVPGPSSLERQPVMVRERPQRPRPFKMLPLKYAIKLEYHQQRQHQHQNGR